MTTRAELKKQLRQGNVVVKIGSGVLTGADGQLSHRTVRRIASEVAPLLGMRRWVYVVSSGAISVGMGLLGQKTRPRSMPGLQAAAAVGQSKLVEAWATAFRHFETPVAQVLLTHSDLADRRRFLNVRRTLGELRRQKAVAVINENDTVSFEEIAFGDNDGLAAQVANVVDANLLVLLSVAPALLDSDGQRVPNVVATDPAIDGWVRPDRSTFGTGGMISKIRAARIAADRGTAVAILDGHKPGLLAALFEGEDVGSVLYPKHDQDRRGSRAHWIAHTLKATGLLLVDDGAANALLQGRHSLLPKGVRAVEGRFDEGDAVSIARETDRVVFARGLCRYADEQMRSIMGLASETITERLGFTAGAAVVHKDDLVLL